MEKEVEITHSEEQNQMEIPQALEKEAKVVSEKEKSSKPDKQSKSKGKVL